MSGRPLGGRRVVTTRDAPGRLDSLLAAAGADVVHVPLIEVVDPADGGAALTEALTRVGSYDWIVVTSRHGAARVGPAVAGADTVRLAAVGAATASSLARLAGRPVDVVPARQTARDLVAALGAGTGRVLVAQADRADSTVADGLRTNGFDVDEVAAYTTRLRNPSMSEHSAALSADAVTFASGSAAEAWAESIGAVAPPVVAAIGPSTAAVCERVGLKATHIAADHHIDGLAAVVVDALAR